METYETEQLYKLIAMSFSAEYYSSHIYILFLSILPTMPKISLLLLSHEILKSSIQGAGDEGQCCGTRQSVGAHGFLWTWLSIFVGLLRPHGLVQPHIVLIRSLVTGLPLVDVGATDALLIKDLGTILIFKELNCEG